MFNRCKHLWVEEQRSISPPRAGGSFQGSQGYVEQQLQESRQGSTEILLRCDHCGDYKTRRLIGQFPKGDQS